MLAAGDYGQSQEYGRRAQQGYYQRGQFQGASGDEQPAKKRTNPTIGIVVAIVTVLITTGVAIWWFVSGDDSPNAGAAQSAPSTAAPSAGVNPLQSPVGTNPSQPPVGTNPSWPPVGTDPPQDTTPGGGPNFDLEQRAVVECTKEISDEYTNVSVSGAKSKLKDSYGDTQWWNYIGTLIDTDKTTKKNVNTSFTYSVFYLGNTKSSTTFVIAEDY